MRRPTTYTGQQVYEWAFSAPAQYAMTAIAKVSQAMFGTSTTVNGLACLATSPASMSVIVGPGEIYQMTSLEATVAGTLPADTAHSILKQGILLDNYTTSAFATPGSSGQSIAYLIQAQYADLDISVDPTTGASPVVLQFYNSDTPETPWTGPNDSGNTSNTFRDGIVTINIKAGAAAATGSQVTPSPDSGYVGLSVVTVAYGQTTITAANIASYPGAPRLSDSLLNQISARALLNGSASQQFSAAAATGLSQAATLAQLSASLGGTPRMSASAALAATTTTFTDDAVLVATALGGATYRIPNFSATLNLAATGIGGMDAGTAAAARFVGVYAAFNPTIFATQKTAGATDASAYTAASGVFTTLESTSAALPTIYGGANPPAGFTATSLIAVLPISATTGQFSAFTLNGRETFISETVAITTAVQQSTPTLLSIAAIVPRSARTVSGDGGIGSSATTTGDLYVSSTINGIGLKHIYQGYINSASTQICSYGYLPITTPQTIFYKATIVTGTMTAIVYISSYVI